MEITEVQVKLITGNKKLKGFANITLDDHFVVRGLKIIRSIDKYFVAMPSQRKKDGSFKDIAHPISIQFRKHLEDTVLEEYWSLHQDNSVDPYVKSDGEFTGIDI